MLKHVLFLVPVLSAAMILTGCGKKHDKGSHGKHGEQKSVKTYPDYGAQHSRHKGAEHRKELKEKVCGKKDKKKCRICGNKTKEGKCVVCGK